MKGHLEIKIGETSIDCLFGMTSLLDFCTEKGIPFSDIEKVLSVDNANMFQDMYSVIYHAHVCYSDWNDVAPKFTRRKIQLLCDQGDIKAIFEGVVAAMFVGIENLVGEKKS